MFLLFRPVTYFLIRICEFFKTQIWLSFSNRDNLNVNCNDSELILSDINWIFCAWNFFKSWILSKFHHKANFKNSTEDLCNTFPFLFYALILSTTSSKNMQPYLSFKFLTLNGNIQDLNSILTLFNTVCKVIECKRCQFKMPKFYQLLKKFKLKVKFFPFFIQWNCQVV